LFLRQATGLQVELDVVILLSKSANNSSPSYFYKNLVMTGGFLYVMAFGAGAVSIDGKTGYCIRALCRHVGDGSFATGSYRQEPRGAGDSGWVDQVVPIADSALLSANR
jgi:hypothetical protein